MAGWPSDLAGRDTGEHNGRSCRSRGSYRLPHTPNAVTAARYPGRAAAVLDGPRKGGAANFLSLLCHADIPEGYVALCDQDDVWMPHKLEHALAQLRPWAGTPSAWAGRYMFTDQYLNPLGLSPHWARGPSLENALVQSIMSGHTLTLNPKALALVRRAGPMPVAHHDWWIYLLLMACNGHALIDTEVVLQYRQHRDNTIGRRAGLRARAGRAIAMVNGTLYSWILGNLAALAATDVPLSPLARHLVDGSTQRSAKIASAALGNFSTHRQHRAETLAFAFAKCLRRLQNSVFFLPFARPVALSAMLSGRALGFQTPSGFMPLLYR